MHDSTVITRLFGDLSPYQTAPSFWVPKPQQAGPVIESLREAKVKTIGRSVGGREIIAIEYGDEESISPTTDNLQSAMAHKIVPPDPTEIYPEAFYGARRTRPVLALQGAIHGGELTGTVASINLCKIIETGKDLRGREWPELTRLARAARLLIVPWANPDGTARYPIVHANGLADDCAGAINNGVMKDGTVLTHPSHKVHQPIAPSGVAFMGTYFNDAGVNLQYDFCSVERQPETTAWMTYYLANRPDGVLVWHSNAGSMIGPPEFFLPPGHQHQFSRIGGAVRSRLVRKGHKIGRLSWACLPGMGKPIFDQTSAIYHVSGAMPVMCELPAGAAVAPVSLDEMLDIGLETIEEVLLFAHTDGLRPYELWEKVKRQMKTQS